MKLTRKKAIELCIELWTWLAKTGRDKPEWPDWEKYESISLYCWFCEYDNRQRERYGKSELCLYCPLARELGVKCEAKVEEGKTLYDKWSEAKTPRTRKKYALLFLGQIQSLRSKK